MSKFIEYKVGDRVKCVDSDLHLHNKIGTIICVDEDEIGVEFDEFIWGHTCDGIGKNGHCWWIYEDNFTDKIFISYYDLEKIETVTINQQEMEKFL